jgi:hypothetical protein
MSDIIIPPWIKWVVLVAVAAAAYAWGRFDGSAIQERKHLSYVAQQATKAVAVVKAQDKVADTTEGVVRERIITIKEKGDVIIKKIPVYIQAADSGKCSINNGFVRVHRASALNEPIGPPAESDRSASGISLATVAETDATNNTNHIACRQQVIGWQNFYAGIRQTLE